MKKKLFLEEIKKIKSLMNINEQCGPDSDKCAEDLRDRKYTVYSPQNVSSNCLTNETIKCVNNILISSGANTKNITIDFYKNETVCYLLIKSNKLQDGVPKYHFTFYSDNQYVYTYLTSPTNKDDKLLYVGKYQCDGNTLTLNSMKYKGYKENNSLINKDKDVIKNSSSKACFTFDNDSNTCVKYSNFLDFFLDKTTFNTKTKGNVGLNDITKLIGL